MSQGPVEPRTPRSSCLCLFKQARTNKEGKSKTVTFKEKAEKVVAITSPKLPGWSRYLTCVAEANSPAISRGSWSRQTRANTTLTVEDVRGGRSGDPQLENLRLNVKPFMDTPNTPAPPKLPLRRDLRPLGPSNQNSKTLFGTPRKVNVFLPSLEHAAPSNGSEKAVSSATKKSARVKPEAKGSQASGSAQPLPARHERLESEYYRARTLLHRKDYYEDRDIPSDPRKYPVSYGKKMNEYSGPIDHFRTYLETLRKDGRVRNKSIGNRVLVQLGQTQVKAVDRIPKIHYMKMLGLEKLLHLEIKPPLLKLSIMNRARVAGQDQK